MPCLRQQAFQLARRSLWPARTFASHPHQWSKRRRGRAPSKNITPQGAHSGAATPAHTAAQRGRSGRRTRGRHDRRATARSAGRGGRDDRRQHSEGSDRGERPACEARAAGDDRRGPATAPHERRHGVCFQRGTSASRRRAAAVACSPTGWPFVLRQPFDRRPSRTRRYLILVPRPRFPVRTTPARANRSDKGAEMDARRGTRRARHSRSQRAACASKRGTSESRRRAAAVACSRTRVAVRSAPAVQPPTVANPPIFDIGSPTPFPTPFPEGSDRRARH
jgi:hypothetical protein